MITQDTGKWIVVIGMALLVIGTTVYFFHDKLNWIGRLPGDIRMVRANYSIYFPLTTGLLFSLLISLAGWLIGKFLR